MTTDHAPVSPAAELMRLVYGFYGIQALLAMVKLGVADRMGDHAVDAHDVARDLGLEGGRLRRLLRLAVTLSVAENEGALFRLTAIRRLLRTDIPGSLAAGVRFFGSDHVQRGARVARRPSGRTDRRPGRVRRRQPL